MKDKIVEALRSSIVGGISSELEMVYFLVNLRKLMERSNSSGEFEYLKFHCDWPLHSTLTGPFAQKVIASFDSVHATLLEDGKAFLTLDASRISGMDEFQQEMSVFLRKHALIDFTRDLDGWARFLFYYSKVIEGCPLLLKSKKPSLVAEIVIAVNTNDEILKGHSFFKISWNIKDIHGKTGEVFVLYSFEK